VTVVSKQLQNVHSIESKPIPQRSKIPEKLIKQKHIMEKLQVTKRVCSVRFHCIERGRRGRDCMVVGFTTTCAISAYHH
jgi:hypothetical protein